MNHNDILKSAKSFVDNFCHTSQNPVHCFHNLFHIVDVVNATEEISEYYNLSDDEYFIVKTAAYFHDLGYISGGPKQHEQRGAALARKFLQDYAVPNHIVQAVESCIISTKGTQHPENLLEKIVCDADLLHFGSATFQKLNFWAYLEAKNIQKIEIDRGIWNAITIKFLENHRYHTTYAQKIYTPEKENNINRLRNTQKRYC